MDRLTKPVQELRDAALRELISRSVAETVGNNQDFEAVADMMRSDAVTFANSMPQTANVDHAYFKQLSREAGMLRAEEYQYVLYHVWVVPQDTIYGDTKHFRARDRYPTRLAIHRGGQLALVHWNRDEILSKRLQLETLERPQAAEFIARTAADTPGGLRRAHDAWVADLKKMSQHYTRSDFRKIRGNDFYGGR